MAVSTKSKITTNHGEIRRWALARNGKPATTPHVEGRKGGGRILCIHFSGHRSAGLQDEISWDEWFKKFDESGLALLYQEHMAGGEKSMFNKLVSRESVDEVQAAVGGKGRSASHKPLREDVQVSEPLNSLPVESKRTAVASPIARKVDKKPVVSDKEVTAEKESRLSRAISPPKRKSTLHRSVKSTSRIQRPE